MSNKQARHSCLLDGLLAEFLPFQAFFWAGVATLMLIWGYFRLFETKGRTFGELDIMFQRGITAQQSAKYKLEGDDIYVAKNDESAPAAASSQKQ